MWHPLFKKLLQHNRESANLQTCRNFCCKSKSCRRVLSGWCLLQCKHLLHPWIYSCTVAPAAWLVGRKPGLREQMRDNRPAGSTRKVNYFAAWSLHWNSPKWYHGDMLLRTLLFGSFRWLPKCWSLSLMNDSSIRCPATVPGTAQSTGPTERSHSKLLSAASQSVGFREQVRQIVRTNCCIFCGTKTIFSSNWSEALGGSAVSLKILCGIVWHWTCNLPGCRAVVEGGNHWKERRTDVKVNATSVSSELIISHYAALKWQNVGTRTTTTTPWFSHLRFVWHFEGMFHNWREFGEVAAQLVVDLLSNSSRAILQFRRRFPAWHDVMRINLKTLFPVGYTALRGTHQIANEKYNGKP